MAFYFSYGSNMSKRVMEVVRNIHPLRSQKSTLLNYKIIMNMPGPNFIEPAFANITPLIGFKVEGMVHQISDEELKRIIASEGENYALIEVKMKFFNQTVMVNTLIYKPDIKIDLPISSRYKNILTSAAFENSLSSKYIDELEAKKSVYYPVLSEYSALRVYFWVKSRAK
jgi:hypothetical protein